MAGTAVDGAVGRDVALDAVPVGPLLLDDAVGDVVAARLDDVVLAAAKHHVLLDVVEDMEDGVLLLIAG